jgi:MbtH protein
MSAARKLQRKECVLMAADEKDDTTPYVVLMNIEEQYSLMPKSIAVPNGWKLVKEGTRAECGAYVNEVWTDMRPLSLRKHMAEFEERKRQQAAQAAASQQQAQSEPQQQAQSEPQQQQPGAT